MITNEEFCLPVVFAKLHIRFFAGARANQRIPLATFGAVNWRGNRYGEQEHTAVSIRSWGRSRSWAWVGVGADSEQMGGKFFHGLHHCPEDGAGDAQAGC